MEQNNDSLEIKELKKQVKRLERRIDTLEREVASMSMNDDSYDDGGAPPYNNPLFYC